MNRCTNCKSNEVLYIGRSWTYLYVLFESLSSLTELFQYGGIPTSEVMLGQTLNYFV
jgi:hypothetical protein